MHTIVDEIYALSVHQVVSHMCLPGILVLHQLHIQFMVDLVPTHPNPTLTGKPQNDFQLSFHIRISE
jgi:hypothetical protein